MANTVNAAVKYLAGKFDSIYKAAAKSAVLDVNPAFVREADIAGTFYLPKRTLVGLGNYSTSTGFPAGDVTLEWGSYTYAADRGRRFTVDKVDNQETALTMFAGLGDQFIRELVVPEIDAYRFAKIATAHGAAEVTGALDTTDKIADALNVGMNEMDNAEVDDGNKILFVTPTIKRLYDSMARAATDSQTDAFDRCQVVVVPPSRFYTTCTLNAGTDASAGGFTNAGSAINFMIVDKGAVFADAKHVALRLFSPEVFQDANAWALDYRLVHDCWAYSNKLDGIYLHTAS